MKNEFNIPKNIVYEMKTIIREEHVAKGIGLDVEVLSTPYVISFMEVAAYEAVKRYLPETHTTVGARICVDHVKPSLKGDTIRIVAKLVSVKGKKLEFKVKAYDSNGLIAKGEHIRYIVDKEKFKSKVLKNTI